MTKYSDAEIERGLQALILADGRSSKAEERLAASGERIPARVLREWRNTKSDRYAELENDRNAWVAGKMADESEFLAAGYAQSEAKLLANVLSRPDEELEKLSPNVLLQAARNASIARGVSIDKANELRLRPTRPDGNVMGAIEALRALQTRYPQILPNLKHPAIDSEAKELKEGES